MKFLMCSMVGEGAGLLYRIQQEGNDVELYIQDPAYRNAWEGILPKAKKISPAKDTTVIFDFSGLGQVADKLKKAGFPVVAGSKWADQMEQDRMFGLRFMEKAGILIPDTYEGKDMADVAKILEQYGSDGKRWYFKPSGRRGLPAHLTYCGTDDADLLHYVAYVQKNFGREVESFVLQERVEGVVVSSEMWHDGKRFIRPANHTVEVKGFMDCDLGPATGCSGNLVWAEPGDCRIVSEGVARVEAAVAEAGYVGPVDLNAVVNDEGVYGLEWCCRFGYDATPTLLALMPEGDVGKFFADVARAQVDHGFPMAVDRVAAGVRLTIPPYPLEADPKDFSKAAPNVGIPIRGITESDAAENFYFYEVMEDDEGELVHSTGTGVVACVTATGHEPSHALDRIYKILDCVKVPDKQYRTDLEEVLCGMVECVEEQDRVSLAIGED